MSERTIDPAELAAFIEGRLPPDRRAEILMRLARSDEDFDVFATAGMARINPFRPTSPISPGMFVGRRAEVQKLARTLAQTRAGTPANFAIIGERGVGKSSLLFYLKALAEGRLSSQQFNFLVIDTDVDPTTTQTSLLSKIALGLERSLAQSEKARAFFAELWSFLIRIEAAGVSIKQSADQIDDVAIERFAYSLHKTVEAITTGERGFFRARHDGVLLIIDEADNASPELRLGSFLKLLLERLSRRQCNRFMLGIAGLPGLVSVLSESHQSALRLFELTRLERLEPAESAAIIVKTLGVGSELNAQEISISPRALSLLVRMADGIPHFVQQLGYSAFAASEDRVIDENDVLEGAYGEEGAMETLGLRYGWRNPPMRGERDHRWRFLRALASAPGAAALEALTKGRLPAEVATALDELERDGLVKRDPEHGLCLASHTLRLWIRYQENRGATQVDS